MRKRVADMAPAELVAHRQRHAAYMREWGAKNRQKRSDSQRAAYRNDEERRVELRFRARIDALRKRGGLDAETREFVPVLHRDPCAYCGKRTVLSGRREPDAATIDHIDAPGDSHWSNLTASCSSCNGAKQQMSLLFALLERTLRIEIAPMAEQIFIVKGSVGQRRRIEF